MNSELAMALAALNLHRNGEVFWMSYDADITDEMLGIENQDLVLAA